MSPDSCFQKIETLGQEFEDEYVLLEPQTGNFFVLDTVSRFIWERLDGATSLKDIAAKLEESYEVELAQALEDICSFTQELLDAELVLPQKIS